MDPDRASGLGRALGLGQALDLGEEEEEEAAAAAAEEEAEEEVEASCHTYQRWGRPDSLQDGDCRTGHWVDADDSTSNLYID